MMLRNFIFLSSLATIACLCVLSATKSHAGQLAEDTTSAVILAYHRIGEDSFPNTSLRREQFEEHIDELTDGSYNLIALPGLIEALKNQSKLPERTVAITFEGGYKSALTYAIPALIKKQVPFTVFFAADLADSQSSQYMSWADLAKLQNTGLASFGLLPASYTRLAGQGQESILQQLNRARTAYRSHLADEPLFFSYPFGEYDGEYVWIIKKQGFAAAFGLQSGVAYAGTDLLQVPRFSMTENYGNVERLQMITHALPLPAEDMEPPYSVLETTEPSIGFTLPPELAERAQNLTCFASGVASLSQDIVGTDRIELRLQTPLQEERTRINCTMPGQVGEADDGIASWRWLGMLFIYRSEEGANPELPELP